MRDGILVVEAKRQMGIVRKMMIKKAGFQWELKLSDDKAAFRLLMYEEAFGELTDALEEATNARLEWYAASDRV